MRGNPLWQLVCVVLLFAAAGLPVWRLTRLGAASVAAVPSPPPTERAEAKAALEVRVSFVPAPADFKLTYLGDQTVLAGQGPAADFSGQWITQIPEGGVDLAWQARWPEATTGHVAARVAVRFPDGRQTEKTFFGEAGERMVEVLTVSGKEP